MRGPLPISVVIPCFNSQLTLRAAVESVFCPGAAIPNEVIIVDDGSTDQTRTLALELSSEHEQVRVIGRQTNGGALAARLDGFRAATSRYVAQLDSDDHLEPSALESAFEVADRTGADVVIWRLIRVDDGNEVEIVDTSSLRFPMAGREAARLSLGTWRMHAVGLLQREVAIASYAETLELNCQNADELATRLVLLRSSKIERCEARYFYVRSVSSVSRTPMAQRRSMVRSDDWLLNFAEREGFLQEDLKLRERMIMSALSRAVWISEETWKQGDCSRVDLRDLNSLLGTVTRLLWFGPSAWRRPHWKLRQLRLMGRLARNVGRLEGQLACACDTET